MGDLHVDLNSRETDFHMWYRAKYHRDFKYTPFQVNMIFRNEGREKLKNDLQQVFDEYCKEYADLIFNSRLDFDIK